jgi:DNA-binding MarR family transcriptional regulator
MRRTTAPARQRTASPDAPVDRLLNRIFFRLFQIGNTLQRQTVNALGITTVQWAVLGALSRPGAARGMTFGELADYLVVSRQNLDGVLQRLERERLVARVADRDDRRARRVQLTAAGRRRWDGLQDKIAEFYDQAAGRVAFDARVSLAHWLNVLLADLQGVDMEVADDIRFVKRSGASGKRAVRARIKPAPRQPAGR